MFRGCTHKTDEIVIVGAAFVQSEKIINSYSSNILSKNKSTVKLTHKGEYSVII